MSNNNITTDSMRKMTRIRRSTEVCQFLRKIAPLLAFLLTFLKMQVAKDVKVSV
jgi:hypothetical protein